MLGSGSAGNSALVSTDHCKILVDGGLSARQIVLRLEQCGVTPDRLDGVLLTHEHGDHVCGLEVLCRKFDVPIYCNALTAEAIQREGLLDRHRNWRIFRTGAEFAICDIVVQTFPVPHDAVEADLPAIIGIYNAAVATRISTAQLEPVTVAGRRDWLSEHSPNRHPFWVAEIDRCVRGWLSFKSFLP